MPFDPGPTRQTPLLTLRQRGPGWRAVNGSRFQHPAPRSARGRGSDTGLRTSRENAGRIRKVNFTLRQGGVITGFISDEKGEPLPGARVMALRVAYQTGEPQLQQSGGDSTDDRGAYRIFGLQPEEYYVVAISGQSGYQSETQNAVGYAPAYYPGVVDFSQAFPVSVGPGQEVLGTNFGVTLVPTARVSGILVDAYGEPSAGGQVLLIKDNGGPIVPGRVLQGQMRNGSFEMPSVPAGSYLLRGRAVSPGGDALFASERLAVDGQDIAGIRLMLTLGTQLAGSLRLFGGTSLDVQELTTIRVDARTSVNLPMGGATTTRVRRDGSFVLDGLEPGPLKLSVADLPEGWVVDGMYLDGQDVTDDWLNFAGTRKQTGVEIVLTDQVTELSGSVRDGRGMPLLNVAVVAFSADETLWGPRSRYIAASRPDDEGMYLIQGLPPGLRKAQKHGSSRRPLGCIKVPCGAAKTKIPAWMTSAGRRPKAPGLHGGDEERRRRSTGLDGSCPKPWLHRHPP